MKISKRMKKIYELFDREKIFSIEEAFSILKNVAESGSVKFNQSVDVCFGMGIDSKKTDQNVKTFVDLPHGNGKKVKILVFANDENVDKALKLGAIYAGGEELIDMIESGKISDFDKCVATPTMMPKIAKIAKILGPKGLMPNPKLGTVVPDITNAVNSLMKGRSEFKSDKDGCIKLSIGKISFETNQLFDNLKEVYNVIKNAKPAAIKSNYFESLYLSTSMGAGVQVKLSEIYNL